MIGLDANLLVRFLAQDDERQSALATALIETCTPANPGFISKIALVETVWVLSTRYKQSRAEIEDIVTGLLRSELIVIEDRDEVEAAINTETAPVWPIASSRSPVRLRAATTLPRSTRPRPNSPACVCSTEPYFVPKSRSPASPRPGRI